MSETNQTTGVSKSASTDRGDVSAKLSEILSCCVDYERAAKHGHKPHSKFPELEAEYDEHFSTAKKYEQSKTFGPENFATIRRFYAYFMAFHHGNVMDFSERFRHESVTGLKTRKILDDLMIVDMVRESRRDGDNLEGISLEHMAQILKTMRESLDRILTGCNKHFQNRKSDANFANVKGLYDDFFEKATTYEKSYLEVHFYGVIMRLWCKFELIHGHLVKIRPDMYS